MRFVDLQDRDGVAVVTIDRLPANALAPELIDSVTARERGWRRASSGGWVTDEAVEAARSVLDR